MMVSLFSIFDPVSLSGSMNWVSMFLFIYVYWSSVWCLSGVVNVVEWKGMLSLVQELTSMLSVCSKSVCLIMPLFTFIFMNNFMGLMPYIFTSTSHVVVTIALALPLWGCVCVWNWSVEVESSFVHLVPMGTPSLLIPFMVVVESLSGLMRPLTLSLRLSANMLAGHLLLSLVGSGGLKYLHLWTVQFLSQTLLYLLEIAVAIIQAYVFSVLVSMYFSELCLLGCIGGGSSWLTLGYFSWFFMVILSG